MVEHLPHVDLANIIRKDKIDILFDMSGHTSGNRLKTFALKPAPIQISWMGYPYTTGLKAIAMSFMTNLRNKDAEKFSKSFEVKNHLTLTHCQKIW